MTQTPPSAAALPDQLLDVTFALTVVVSIALVAAFAVGHLARRLLTAVGRQSFAEEPLVQRTLRVVRGLTFLVVFAVLAFPALDVAGVRPGVGMASEDLGRWAARSGVRILALIVLALVVSRVVSSVIVGAERELPLGGGLDALERRKRTQTVATLARRALSGVIWTAAGLMVLRELDVDITPVLAGAGILGLALGFGAQTLVRDIITGIFLIAEDQVRVGDVATVNGVGGLVEQINLRTIVLRDVEGAVHVFPNGEVKTLANRTKDFSFYVIDLAVDYHADLDRVTALVRRVGAELQTDPAYGPSILAPVEVLGVDDIKTSTVIVKLRIKTVPLKQWEVGRELRRRIKEALHREDIQVPTSVMEVRVLRDDDDAET